MTSLLYVKGIFCLGMNVYDNQEKLLFGLWGLQLYELILGYQKYCKDPGLSYLSKMVLAASHLMETVKCIRGSTLQPILIDTCIVDDSAYYKISVLTPKQKKSK